MIQTLQLRYVSGLDAAPDAWFLPGHTTAQWMDELARCGLARMETKLFVVPQSMESRMPAGLLVVPARAKDLTEYPAGLACRLIGGRLFIPVDAVLHPPVTDPEVCQLMGTAAAFFHPVFGLSSFAEEDALRVSDLVELPQDRDANWNSARPGMPGLPGFAGIILIQPPSIADLFGGAEEDIATESPEDLPPAPDEPGSSGMADAKRKLRKFFARGVSNILRQFPHTGRGRTWVNDAEDWANRQVRGVDAELEKLRQKELHRLLHLLETDPETGLRHAIPMSGFAHRGVAPPSSKLGTRSLDFNPNRLGGRAADFWHIQPDMQETLRQRYREMANREIQLGRHRRAAYIYAELLGDLFSAANAFKQGNLYREAAVLFEEHLKNPLEAAHCYAKGGFIAEAVERYAKLGRWLDVADLHERAGNLDAANDALRKVVNERLAQGDILGAAKLVEERLHQPDEALAMLLGVSRASHQAVSCTAAAFQLMARLGRHEAALDRLAQFRREQVFDGLVQPLVAALVGISKDYPHETVRQQAADFARVLIARLLNKPGTVSNDAARLLEQLVRLAPQDRLLSRDANRYLADLRALELRVRRVTPPPVVGSKPVLVRRFELPRQIQWLQLRSEWHSFFALGVTPKRLTLLRGDWGGEFQSLSWDCPAEAVKNGFIFEPTAEQGRAVALARPGSPPLKQQRFPRADVFFNQECFAGTPSWLPTQGYPFAVGSDAVWSAHVASGRAILSCHDKVRGQLQKTFDITDDLLAGGTRTEETHLSLTVVETNVVVALGNRLVATLADGRLVHVELPGQVVRLVPTIVNTRRGVAVMLHAGAVMYWLGMASCMELDRDIHAPFGAFVPGGPLVLASGSQVILLDVHSTGVQSVVRMEPAGQRIIGTSSTANPGEFALLNERGEILIYRMPR